jgi:hypothetical protein
MHTKPKSAPRSSIQPRRIPHPPGGTVPLAGVPKAPPPMQAKPPGMALPTQRPGISAGAVPRPPLLGSRHGQPAPLRGTAVLSMPSPHAWKPAGAAPIARPAPPLRPAAPAMKRPAPPRPPVMPQQLDSAASARHVDELADQGASAEPTAQESDSPRSAQEQGPGDASSLDPSQGPAAQAPEAN